MNSPIGRSYVYSTESCGRQILTSRVRWPKRVWYAQNRALEIFETEIRPFVDGLLQDLETQHVDVFVRVYMIGRKPTRADPFVFVCCTDLNILHEADQSIRSSIFTQRFPGFRLGKSAIPLEAHVPLRRIANTQTSPDKDQLRNKEVFQDKKQSATNSTKVSEVRVGSSLSYARLDAVEPYLAKATGGPVLYNGSAFYQLTTRHLWDKSAYPSPANFESSSLEYCSFDGEDEDQDVEDDSDSEIMSLGSASSAATSPSGVFTAERVASLCSTPPAEYDVGFHARDTQQDNTMRAGSAFLTHSNASLQNATSVSTAKITRPGEGIDEEGIAALEIVDTSNNNALQQGLDYTLIQISDAEQQFLDGPNCFDDDGRPMIVGAPLGSPSHQTEIIALCGSSGPVHGILIPGAISHVQGGQSTSIYQVQLKSAVVSGDSGSAVVDAATGRWYGQIVFGCSGTNQAYFVSAIEILDDINADRDLEHFLEVYKNSPAVPSHSHVSEYAGHHQCTPISAVEQEIRQTPFQGPFRKWGLPEPLPHIGRDIGLTKSSVDITSIPGLLPVKTERQPPDHSYQVYFIDIGGPWLRSYTWRQSSGEPFQIPRGPYDESKFLGELEYHADHNQSGLSIPGVASDSLRYILIKAAHVLDGNPEPSKYGHLNRCRDDDVYDRLAVVGRGSFLFPDNAWTDSWDKTMSAGLEPSRREISGLLPLPGSLHTSIDHDIEDRNRSSATRTEGVLHFRCRFLTHDPNRCSRSQAERLVTVKQHIARVHSRSCSRVCSNKPEDTEIVPTPTRRVEYWVSAFAVSLLELQATGSDRAKTNHDREDMALLQRDQMQPPSRQRDLSATCLRHWTGQCPHIAPSRCHCVAQGSHGSHDTVVCFSAQPRSTLEQLLGGQGWARRL